jgi:hypothetical protein
VNPFVVSRRIAEFSCALALLQDSVTCTELGATNFNVSFGKAPGTVVFTVVGQAPDEAIGLCVDYNAGIDQLELYPCYNYENRQQVRPVLFVCCSICVRTLCVP